MAHQNPTHNDHSEGFAVDCETSATTVPATPAVPAASTVWLPQSLPFAHAAILNLNDVVQSMNKHVKAQAEINSDLVIRIRDLNEDVRAGHTRIAELNAELAEKRTRIDGLTLAVRDLESAIYKRDAEIAQKSAMVIHHSNETQNAEARVESLQMNVDVLREKVARRDETIEEWKGEHADALTNVQYLADRVKSMESDMSGTLDNARELAQLLDASGKREDRMHETIIGVRAFAESDTLSDHEKVALIVRLIAK